MSPNPYVYKYGIILFKTCARALTVHLWDSCSGSLQRLAMYPIGVASSQRYVRLPSLTGLLDTRCTVCRSFLHNPPSTGVAWLRVRDVASILRYYGAVLAVVQYMPVSGGLLYSTLVCKPKGHQRLLLISVLPQFSFLPTSGYRLMAV